MDGQAEWQVKIESNAKEIAADVEHIKRSLTDIQADNITVSVQADYRAFLREIKELQRRLNAAGLTLNIDCNFDRVIQKIDISSFQKPLKNIGSKMAKELTEQFKVVDKTAQKQIAELSKQLTDIRIKGLKSGGNYDINAFTDTMVELEKVIVNNANTIQERMGIYDQFYDYLKKLGTIKISDSIRSDLGDNWNELRNLYPNKFSISKGIELDSIYQELSSKFFNIFKGESNPTEQFKELCAAIKNYRNDINKIEPLDANTLGIEDDIFESIIVKLGELDRAFKQNNASKSAADIGQEVSALQDVEKSARAAADKKEQFTQANLELEKSAGKSADAVSNERDALAELDEIDRILQNVNASGQQGNSVFQRFGNTLQDAFMTYSAANLLQDALYKVVDAGKEAVETVKDLNDLKTDLTMVTGYALEDVDNLIKSYSELGQELGATTAAVGESADSFLRQGRTMQETDQLIRDSLVLSKVAKVEAEESAEILTSTINGFQMAANEAGHINDMLSSIDLASASDAGGIGKALQRVASMANNAGVSLEKTAAIIATIKDVTQDSDESIGNGLKSILSRMNQIRAGKFIDAETGEALNDVEKVLNKVGISMRDTNNQFLASEMILDNVADKWQSFDKNTQKAVSTALAGTYQYNKLIAVMDNWSKVENLTGIAKNSDGSALNKFEISLESLESKTQSLKASLESLASETISDELYAEVLDISKGMIDAVNSTGLLKGALAGLGTAGSMYALQQLVSYLKEGVQGFSNLNAAMQMTRGNAAVQDMEQLLTLTQGLSKSQTKLLLSTQNLSDAQKIAVLQSQGLSRAEASATLQTWGLTSAQGAAVGATVTLSGALKGLWATLMANPLILVTAAVTAGVMAWNKYKQAQEEAARALSDSLQVYDEANSSVKSLESELGQCAERLKELQKIADNGTISVTEEEELNRLKETNAELERNLAVEKERRKLAALDAAKEADDKADDTIYSQYDKENVTLASDYVGTQTLTRSKQVSYADELENAINEYGKLEQEINDLNSAYDRGEVTLADYETSIAGLVAKQETARARALEMYESTSDIESAYKGVIDAGEQLTSGQQSTYDSVVAANTKYAEFCNTVQDTAQALDKVSKAGQSASGTLNIGQIANKQEMISGINELSEGFESLNKIMSSMKGKSDFDYALLDDKKFKETFSGLGDVYTDFVEKISNSPKDVRACQNAYDSLVTAFVNSSGVLQGLSEETAQLTEDMLTNMGVTNAEEAVTEALAQKQTELAACKEFLAVTGTSLASATVAEIQAFIQSGQAAAETADYYVYLAIKKQIAEHPLDNAADIAALEQLCIALGVTGELYDKVIALKNIFNAVDGGAPIEAYQSAIDGLNADIENILNGKNRIEVDFDYGGVDTKASSAGKEAADKYVEAFEKELKQLDTLKERGKINEKQYLDALLALASKYFKGRKKYLDKFKEYEYKYLQGMKSLYESAMSGIIGIYDDHISALNEEKEAALDSLEAQRDAAIDALEAKKEQIEAEKELIQEKIDGIDKEIEAKQDQIDAINDEAEAKKKAYDLDKAKYELDRLKNQRTIYEYSGKEKGFIYKTDDKAIRDQQMEVEDIEREIRIDKIEKEIDLLEKQKEVLQDQQEELEKQQAAIDKRIDAMNDYYDNLIANTESYWDNMIKGFEETKSRWEELQELQEKAELDTLLKSVTGKGIDEVLAMTEADFNAFKELYLSNVAAINSGNQDMLDSFSKLSGVDLSTLPNYLEETAEYINMLSTGIDFSNMDESLGGVIDSFGKMAESAGHATGAIIGGGFTSSSGSTGTSKGEGSQSSGGQGAGSDLNSAVDTLKTEALPKVEEFGDAFDGGSGGEDGESSGGVAGAVTTARDTIGPGGESGKGGGKGESGEGSNLQDTLDIQTEAALDPETGIPAQTEAWTNLDGILASVEEHLTNIKSILENMPEVEVTGGSLKIFATGTDPGFKIGNAYAKGVDGLKHAERNALRSEYGQPELTVYPNGKAELTTSPIMSDLPKGTVIYNEKQTMDILDGKAEAIKLGTPVAIAPAFQNMAADFQKAVQSDPAALLSGISSQMENITKELQPIHVEQKNTSNSYVTTIGDIHLHEVQNVDTLGRAIATRLPTAVKQMMSIKR